MQHCFQFHFLFTSHIPSFTFVSVLLFQDTKFMVEGLVNDVEYEFRVTSVNRAGAGSHSTISNAVVAKDPIRESLTFCMFFPSVPLLIKSYLKY